MKFKKGIGWLCILLLTLNIVSNIQIKNVQATTDNVDAKGNILFKMENPVQDHELTGDFFIKGYALSTVGISKVEVYLDGVLNGTADYGIKRDDIGKKYNNVYLDAYNSGFTYKFKGASNGEHYLTIKAIDRDGNEQLTSASIIISNEKKLVMGNGHLTKDQMLQDIYSRCTRLSKEEMNEFIEYVMREANIEGVNYDVAYALMMLETNYLNFGGDVKPDQNNFGGLGATGNGVPGLSFETVQIGVRAVVQHIKAYGSKENLVQALVDPRFKYVERGSAIYVEYLGIKENPEGKGWAAGKDYGKKIKSIINRVALYSTVFNNSYVRELNVDGNYLVGNKINITSNSSDNNNTLFKTTVREKSTNNVITVKEYSSERTSSFTPSKEGTYIIEVNVRHKSSSNSVDDTWTKEIYVDYVSSSITSVDITEEVFKNTPVTITVNADPKNSILYRMWVKENGEWRVISDYSEKNIATFTPKSTGTYAVQVDVKNKYSNNNYDDVWSAFLEVNNAKPTINNVEIIGERKVGNAITIKVNSTPITGLLYRIWVKEEGNWKIISDYSEKNIAEFTPKKLGIYPIQVDVKFKDSTNIYDSVYSELIDINVPALSKIEDIQVIGEMKAQKPITISAKANPSNSTLYRIWVKENGIWKIISDFSKQNKVVYTPKSDGSYAVQIDVKNEYSLNTIDDVTSKLISIGKSDKKTIVIDAGHGGKDGGASATHGFTTFKEATIALKISLKLKSYLESRGYNVHMTRTTDTYVKLVDRAKFANNIMADLFISVHCNSFTRPSATGVEVLYTKESMDSSVRDELISMGYEDPEINKQNRINQSKSLATIISKNLADSIGLLNRGAKLQNINVLRNTIMPAVLVECGFISNPNDILLLSLDSNQDTIARAITNTLVDVFK